MAHRNSQQKDRSFVEDLFKIFTEITDEKRTKYKTVETKKDKLGQEVPRSALSCSGTQNGANSSYHHL